MKACLIPLTLAACAWCVAQDTQPAANENRWLRNIRQLTTAEMGLARTGEAYFSRDGRKICFQAWPTGKEEYQIYVMNIDGTGLKMISTGTGATTCSYFHPDGARLLFAANHDDLREPTRPEELEPMRPRPVGDSSPASDPRPAAAGGHPGQGVPAGEERKHGEGAAKHGGGGMSYAWKYFPGMEIYEYSLASGTLRKLTNSEGYDAEGSYSPDGKSIVFSSFRDGDQEIYICDADGTNPRRITHATGGDGGPFFSPDGKRIVYRSDRKGDGTMQVFVNNFEGTDERAITPGDALHWCPYWHPSGKWLIFTHANFRQRPNFDLYLVRDDGSQMTRITTDPEFDGLPVFSPDGKYLMWTSKRNGLPAPQVFMAEFVGLTPDGALAGPRP